MRRALFAAVAVLGIGLWVGSAYSLGPEHKHDHEHAHGHEHGEEEFKPVPVGPQHQVLLDGVGEWTTVQKMWMHPGGEPTVGYGKETVRKMLDGQAILFEYEGTTDQGTFKGFGTATWNTITKQYEGTWLDTMSYNGVANMWGVHNPTEKTITWHWSFTAPDGTKFPTRMVEKHEGKDRNVATFYMTGPDGQEFKHMEIAYTRAK